MVLPCAFLVFCYYGCMQNMKRLSGILLQPTSLPGPYGVGELSKEAYRWVDFLADSGQGLWQILPLGPTGYGDSPYASFSTFAGNPLWISLDQLAKEGWLTKEDLADKPDFPTERVDYGWVQSWKFPKLNLASERFLHNWQDSTKPTHRSFRKFLREESFWLDDFALWMAVKDHFQKKAEQEGLMGKRWNNFWDRDIALKEPKAVEAWSKKLEKEILVKKVIQFWFYHQWLKLKQYANKKGIQIIGDIPIYVAEDSSDVWANRHLFHLDANGVPTVVAGVPPDYFSETGQLWGNPLYNWDAMKQEGFKWWLMRIKAMLRLTDILRIDHFRGFEAYWEVPNGSSNAINGRWVKAPGEELFQTVKKNLGNIPIIAEDLGVITPEVEALRDGFELPGMKILQFAFDSNEAGSSGENQFLPHNYPKNCIVYTGTHDNETTRGWLNNAKPADKALAMRYCGVSREKDAVWGMIRAAWASVARMAVVPVQDILDLGNEARMNTPSLLSNTNWSWRLTFVPKKFSKKLRELTMLYGRLNKGLSLESQ